MNGKQIWPTFSCVIRHLYCCQPFRSTYVNQPCKLPVSFDQSENYGGPGAHSVAFSSVQSVSLYSTCSLAFTSGSTVSMIGVGLESHAVCWLYQTFIPASGSTLVEWEAHTHKDRGSKLSKVWFSTLWMENKSDQLSVVSSAIYIEIYSGSLIL